MKALRAIRFDASDTHVFEVAAEPEEWVVSGASTFAGLEPASLRGKLRQAFANGFLGTSSLGHATFAVVASSSDDALAQACLDLENNLQHKLGAPPDVAAALAAGEVAYACEMCEDLAAGTVLAVTRRHETDGQIAEQFRRIDPARATAQGEPSHDRIWTIVADDD